MVSSGAVTSTVTVFSPRASSTTPSACTTPPERTATLRAFELLGVAATVTLAVLTEPA